MWSRWNISVPIRWLKPASAGMASSSGAPARCGRSRAKRSTSHCHNRDCTGSTRRPSAKWFGVRTCLQGSGASHLTGEDYKMDRREVLGGAAALAGSLALPGLALAQQATEISFFYPVAVGGPISKLIDAYAAGFEKENPSIKVKPIYAGTYQETIVKALTAHKSGNPPTT